MGYAIYRVGQRYAGYGVPAVCEHPDCSEEIDRGVSYACGSAPFSEHGCDMYFCSKHLNYVYFNGYGGRCRHRNDCECEMVQICERCQRGGRFPFPYKPETPEWASHLLKDKSWKKWREDNPEKVNELKNLLSK